MGEYIPRIPVEDLVHITFMNPDPDDRDSEGREMKQQLMRALKNGNINKGCNVFTNKLRSFVLLIIKHMFINCRGEDIL